MLVCCTFKFHHKINSKTRAVHYLDEHCMSTVKLLLWQLSLHVCVQRRRGLAATKKHPFVRERDKILWDQSDSVEIKRHSFNCINDADHEYK